MADGSALPPVGKGHLAAALEWAGRKVRVFPCEPVSKKPFVSGGFKAASLDPLCIKEWWQRWPDALIGMPTGEITGVFALDVDIRDDKNGFAALAALEASYGPLPPTWTQRTPRGGEHRLFAWPGIKVKNSTSEIGLGLDIRGDGGYIILAPSIDTHGRYQCTDTRAPVAAPDWLVTLANDPKQRQPPDEPSTFSSPASHDAYVAAAVRNECDAVASASTGTRNDTLNRAAFSLGQFVGAGVIDRATVEARLAAAARHLAADDGEASVQRTIRSGIEKGMLQPREIPPRDRRTIFHPSASNPARPASAGNRQLEVGSDVELAGHVHEDLSATCGRVVHSDGHFWRYTGTHWETIPDHIQRLAVHRYDGTSFMTASGKPSLVKLNKSRIDSILNECAPLCADPTFFEAVPVGINCASGFIRFDQDGTPSLAPHDREHRCRHTLPGRWTPSRHAELPAASLLSRLLTGVFQGDPDLDAKVALVAEVCGAAALGYATRLLQPRAVILKGETAENGKSQILELARGVLPKSAIASVTAARMSDERHVIGLVGKLLNASDELSSSAAIASGTFKAIITGDPVDGRDVYKTRVEFRPVAQHLFATNTMPPFQGGIDRGVQRRLLVITFRRVIPLEERVEHIGHRIATEEADLLLAWVVAGAERLIRQRNYTVPPSSQEALAEWISDADPVLAWLAECVEVQPIVQGSPWVTTRVAYEAFHGWAVAEGFKQDKLPAINGFVQRVTANAAGVEYRRTNAGRRLLGLRMRRSTV